jgi:hypothetical protein
MFTTQQWYVYNTIIKCLQHNNVMFTTQQWDIELKIHEPTAI